MNKWYGYLSLLRLMYRLGTPFEDRMSLEEFKAYEKKIFQGNEKAGWTINQSDL